MGPEPPTLPPPVVVPGPKFTRARSKDRALFLRVLGEVAWLVAGGVGRQCDRIRRDLGDRLAGGAGEALRIARSHGDAAGEFRALVQLGYAANGGGDAPVSGAYW